MVLVVLPVLLALGACGDDGDIEIGDQPATTSATAESSPETTAVQEEEGEEEESTTTAPAAADIEPCDLVTQDEASTLAGTPVEEAVPVTGMCQYTGPVDGPLAQVEVHVGDGAQKILEIDRDTLAHEFTEVPGIGDEATAEDGAIFLRVGTTWVALRLVSLEDDAVYAPRLVDLARIVADRLAG
jgi:hypothetical protein